MWILFLQDPLCMSELKILLNCTSVALQLSQLEWSFRAAPSQEQPQLSYYTQTWQRNNLASNRSTVQVTGKSKRMHFAMANTKNSNVIAVRAPSFSITLLNPQQDQKHLKNGEGCNIHLIYFLQFYKAFNFFPQIRNQIKGALKFENIHLIFWFPNNNNWPAKWLHHPLWKRAMKNWSTFMNFFRTYRWPSMEKRKQIENLYLSNSHILTAFFEETLVITRSTSTSEDCKKWHIAKYKEGDSSWMD